MRGRLIAISGFTAWIVFGCTSETERRRMQHQEAVEAAARGFHEKKSTLERELAEVEKMTLSPDYDSATATTRIAALRVEVDPLFESAIAQQADVAELRERLNKVRDLVGKRKMEQRRVETEAAVEKQKAEDERKAAEHLEAMFTVECETLVKQNLKAPSDAEFPGALEQPEVVTKKNGTKVWTAWVDAQNSFGAKLRTWFDCTLAPKTGKITVRFRE